MPRMPKRTTHAEASAPAARAEAALMTADQFEALCAYLDRALTRTACDGRLTRTQRWLERRGLNARANLGALRAQGGCCDCEVLMNVAADGWLNPAARAAAAPHHPQVTVTDRSGALIDVDEELAGMLQDLWALGLDTCMSCQDMNGAVWIAFARLAGGRAFLAAALPASSEQEIAARAAHLRALDDLAAEMSALPAGPSVERCRLGAGFQETPGWAYTASLFGGLHVRFPRAELARVTQCLHQAVRPSPRSPAPQVAPAVTPLSRP